MRTPKHTNLGQIVGNLLLNEMKNKTTFEKKHYNKILKHYELFNPLPFIE